MQLTETNDGEVLVVGLDGRLDATSSKTVESRLLQLIDGGARRLVLDLSGMDYVSSVGLRVLMVVAKKLKPLAGKVVVCGLQPSIKQVFEIAGFGSIFTTFATRQDAVAAIR